MISGTTDSEGMFRLDLQNTDNVGEFNEVRIFIFLLLFFSIFSMQKIIFDYHINVPCTNMNVHTHLLLRYDIT